MANKVKRTERGWQAHLIVRCAYHRNTLLEYKDQKIVVSTVGSYINLKGQKDTIGSNNRYYETMVFESCFENPYWEIDVSKEIIFDSEWSINECERETDLKAEYMHEKVVAEIVRKLIKGTIENV